MVNESRHHQHWDDRDEPDNIYSDETVPSPSTHPCPTCDGDGMLHYERCPDCGGDRTHMAYQ